ncbi:MAG: hypothetical protein AAGK05_16775 [Pseudomonadota bacterium]
MIKVSRHNHTSFINTMPVVDTISQLGRLIPVIYHSRSLFCNLYTKQGSNVRTHASHGSPYFVHNRLIVLIVACAFWVTPLKMISLNLDTEAGARKKLKKVVDGNPTTTDTERPRKRKAPSMLMMEAPITEGGTPVREVPHHAIQSSIVPHDTEVCGTSEDHSASASTPGSSPGPVVHQEVFPDVQGFEDSSINNALAGMHPTNI